MKKKKKHVINGLIVFLIIVALAVVVFLLTYKEETHITEKFERSDASALVCTSHINDSDEAFFYSDTATSVKHIIKYVYSSGKLDKLSYEYEGDYTTNEAAKQDSGYLHTKYNLYLGEHDVKHEILTPVFQFDGYKARIRLYLDDYGKMNSAIGKIFYIGSGVIDAIGKNNVNETKNIYENKGFSCIISG